MLLDRRGLRARRAGPVASRTCGWALALALAAGCGGGADPGGGDGRTPTSGTTPGPAASATPTPAGSAGPGAASTPPSGSPAARAGSFPDRPQLLLEFANRPPSWPERVRKGGSAAGYRDGRYRLRAAPGATLRVPASRGAEPPERGVLLQTVVKPPPAPGAAGLFCRGSGDDGYELLVSANGEWRVDRVLDGARRTLDRGRERIATDQPDRGTPLRLICGAGKPGEGLTLAFTVGVNALQGTRDPRPLLPPGTGKLGLVARGSRKGASTSFEGLAVTFAE